MRSAKASTRQSLLRTCAISCAKTPVSSRAVNRRSRPSVMPSAALSLVPTVKAFIIGLGDMVQLRHSRQMDLSRQRAHRLVQAGHHVHGQRSRAQHSQHEARRDARSQQENGHRKRKRPKQASHPGEG